MPSETPKFFDPEIREMISALTNRLANLQHVQMRSGSSSSNHHEKEEEEDDEHGVRIITLAGNNVGATMRGEMDQKLLPEEKMLQQQQDQNEGLSTYVNSNFQAINNSIMIGGSYSSNDPGVHMDISDYVEEQEDSDDAAGHEKKGKKKKKKRSSSKSNDHYQQTEFSE
ncbi:hypothetical protein M9H77_20102 [Catharanthus roseus]|uniref:Uncharacterized protein n=1 Tax=Catharanthus roseus TaxID=4058 RepID=A0ACC0AKT5_CATRO|nr:hypothetical protein M9H77_20102 [Catharanthus roseus]